MRDSFATARFATIKRNTPKLRERTPGALAQTSEQSVSIARPLEPIRPAGGSGRPIAVLARPLPDMSNFAAEFFEYCAGRARAPKVFAKLQAFGAKLLAMQRAPL